MDWKKEASENKEHLYLTVYRYYQELILKERLPAGSKMPSLRTCAREFSLSRTTIENAYFQLAADGYIAAKAQSGYYVTDIAAHRADTKPLLSAKEKEDWRYDFASAGVDRESFRFDLWQRYIKSALRQDDRLLSYGEPQGEWDLRQALCGYVRKHRNILCSPEDIVVGAGMQSLLHILCPLLPSKKTVSFPTPSFIQGSRIFEDYGFDVHYRDKECDVIYVSPAHMTKWGEIMPVKRRLELVHLAAEKNRLVIEDDFENEFVYLQKPTPSLYGLSGGNNVVYLGSFSRLLLPSIRISFMILPRELTVSYAERAALYNQTASKAEQIALCQFIRDGHLAAQTRKLRRLYAQKLKALTEAVHQVFGADCHIKAGSAGTSIALTVPCPLCADICRKRFADRGLRVSVQKNSSEEVTLILSCSSMPTEDFVPACKLLKEVMASLW